MMRSFTLKAPHRGFTMVEMVVAITIGGIVIGFMAMFLTAPVTSYFAQTRRAQLVDGAESLSRHLTRDIKTALPTSVRQGVNGANFRVIQMITLERTVDGVESSVRYDPATLTTGPGGDASINILGQYISDATAFDDFPAARVAIGAFNSNPYGAGVLSAIGNVRVASTLPDSATVTFQASVFTSQSPSNRLFMTSGTVAYLCDIPARTLTRYDGFPIVANIALHDTTAELNAASTASSVIARDVRACTFVITPPTAAIPRGQVSIRVTLNSNGELLHVFEQVPMELGP
jgi:MSHA biogenesis protein MshO